MVTDQNGNPLCVLGIDEDRDGKRTRVWCVCTRRDPRALNSKTLCGMFVVMPGSYEHRQPTCPECAKAWENRSKIRNEQSERA